MKKLHHKIISFFEKVVAFSESQGTFRNTRIG